MKVEKLVMVDFPYGDGVFNRPKVDWEGEKGLSYIFWEEARARPWAIMFSESLMCVLARIEGFLGTGLVANRVVFWGIRGVLGAPECRCSAQATAGRTSREAFVSQS